MRGLRAVAGVALVAAAACSGGDDASSPTTTARETTTSSTTTTTAPERPASTTTTAFDPASVEGQVEAAYLKSWDVYATAVYDEVVPASVEFEVAVPRLRPACW